MNLKLKLTLIFTALIVFILGIFSIVTFVSSKSNLTAEILRQMEYELGDISRQIQNKLNEVQRDIVIIKDVSPLAGIIRARDHEGIDPIDNSTLLQWINRYEVILHSLSKSKPEYYQLRYIDETGKEVVRVYHDGTNAIIAGESELQDKSDQEYFDDTMRLPADQLYISRVNLNRENDQIETPFKPTIRIAMPLFNETGERKGIIIINYNAVNLFTVHHAIQGNFYLINQNGYYLVHPDESKEYGFDLNHTNTLKDLHPILFSKIKDEDHLVLNSDSLDPNREDPVLYGFQKIEYNPFDAESYWAVVFDVPYKTAFAPINDMTGAFVMMWIFCLIIGVIVSRIISNGLSKQFMLLSAASKQIANGDLTVQLPDTKRKDEIGTLTTSFQLMVNSLQEIIQKTKEGINTLSSSTNEILAAVSQVSASTSETAVSVNQTTATMEEVKQTINVTSQKSKNVVETAKQAKELTDQGLDAVEETIHSMNRIQEQMNILAERIVQLSDQSQTISEIISTVDALAEQSNLLAVNAAIEAAKAGEQGKGFAVVAQEVRNLSDQSKQATSRVRVILYEIQKAISSSVMSTEQSSRTVDDGVKLSQKSGETIRHLSGMITESAQAAVQISASTQEQLAGIGQVVSAMENIQQACSQNAAGSKQTEQSARDLLHLGQQLKQLIANYKV